MKILVPISIFGIIYKTIGVDKLLLPVLYFIDELLHKIVTLFSFLLIVYVEFILRKDI